MSLHDILHEIVDHLPINEKLKQELQLKVLADSPEGQSVKEGESA